VVTMRYALLRFLGSQLAIVFLAMVHWRGWGIVMLAVLEALFIADFVINVRRAGRQRSPKASH